MSWDVVPWIVEAIGLLIIVVWTIIPIREFVDIYRRLSVIPPVADSQQTTPEPKDLAA